MANTNEKYTIVNTRFAPYANANVVEIVMEAACTKADLPTNVAPSSLAYRVSSGIPAYAFSADGAWEDL